MKFQFCAKLIQNFMQNNVVSRFLKIIKADTVFFGPSLQLGKRIKLKTTKYQANHAVSVVFTSFYLHRGLRFCSTKNWLTPLIFVNEKVNNIWDQRSILLFFGTFLVSVEVSFHQRSFTIITGARQNHQLKVRQIVKLT